MAVPADTGRRQTVAPTGKARGAQVGGGRERYRVDLTTYHADCDANYLRLCKLMPELATNQHWRYQMPQGTLEMAVLERSRYTTEVSLRASMAASSDRGDGWLTLPPITVRLYHDARMAEVVAVNGQGPVGGDGLNFRYPNPAMHNEDERQQVNRYLSEWLAHCLANARVEFTLPAGINGKSE
ncbi:DUF1249 domain-containing protein [Microbulbifer agarilyticus]|uniref:DUF1249 domain-containing protein n=1 Tax=Microbulbifer agarilyticus TaxID=260552 RepID=UPI001C96F1FC|nr:DUF1249 domain-containing protein [Microbulbifer agarilyticus]MBY6210212.1 DUF1249 domain-containing protein [Microbulbifer agarilyticus]